MTWPTIKATGRGVPSFRLMIEGCPDEWVTNVAITHANGKDGRRVHGGLLHDGLVIGERVIMQEAKIQADAITFKIRPSSPAETPMSAFTKYPAPIGILTVELTTVDTGVTTTATLTTTGGAYSSGVYHMGSEAFRVTEAGTPATITREVWNTKKQAFHIQDGLNLSTDASKQIFIYDYPPTMEGRHAFLYAYGTGDDLADEGAVIWRGIVSRPPALDSDGVTWSINCAPITQVLQQQVAGFIKDASPVGIYHHATCTLWMRLRYSSVTYPLIQYNGFDATENILIGHVNTKLADMVSVTSNIDSIVLERNATGWQLHLKTNSASTQYARIEFASLLLGAVDIGDDWQNADPAANSRRGWGPVSTDFFAASSEYYKQLRKVTRMLVVDEPGAMEYPGLPISPLGDAGTLARAGTVDEPSAATFLNIAVTSTYSPWRIYLDSDFTGAESVYITDTNRADGTFTLQPGGAGIDGSGVAFIDIVPWAASMSTLGTGGNDAVYFKKIAAVYGFMGYLTSSTKINAVRNYGTGSVVDFVGSIPYPTSLEGQAPNANDGDTPWITDHDFADTLYIRGATDPIQLAREYVFSKPRSVEDILVEELKLANCFIRLGSDGRIEFAPYPDFTEATAVATSHVIDQSGIITPAGSYGMWPGWEPQRDGLITAVDIKHGYDGIKDEWQGKPVTYQDANAIAIHHTRGKVQATIQPYSHELQPPDDLVHAYADIAGKFLAAFSREYAVITVKVPFKHFDVLCGDTVSLTHPLIPASDGTRGIVAQRGICIEKRWNLDPRSEDAGELKIIIYREGAPKGYAPSGHITSGAGAEVFGPYPYTLGFDIADSLNIEWSTDGDGNVTQHFTVGDKIRVVTMDDDTSPEVLGTVTSVNNTAHTVGVDMVSAIPSPSAEHVLEFERDMSDAATDAQHRFMYVADDTFALPDGVTFARKLA